MAENEDSFNAIDVTAPILSFFLVSLIVICEGFPSKPPGDTEISPRKYIELQNESWIKLWMISYLFLLWDRAIPVAILCIITYTIIIARTVLLVLKNIVSERSLMIVKNIVSLILIINVFIWYALTEDILQIWSILTGIFSAIFWLLILIPYYRAKRNGYVEIANPDEFKVEGVWLLIVIIFSTSVGIVTTLSNNTIFLLVLIGIIQFSVLSILFYDGFMNAKR